MSVVKKLSIRGIRSFGPDTDQIIEFYMPLTMIVGSNGCGKTTIIECLRYATTGILPPNSRNGQTFVHDPKMSNTTEVKAQIKLRLQRGVDMPIVVVRSLQLTQKKTTMQFKALDGVLKYGNNDGGNTSSTGVKCTDLDKQLPTLMRVSRAILESVIFCHQEESSWPLQEGAVLKKKFDDIFESARYTKALDVIKATRVELANKVKDYKAELAALTAHSEAADALQNDLQQTEQKCADVQEQMAQLEEAMKELQEELDEHMARAQQAAILRQEMQNLTARIRETQAQISEKEAHMTNLYPDESDADLQAYLDKFDTTLAGQHEKLEGLRATQADARRGMAQQLDARNALHGELGRVEAQMAEQEKRIRQCEELARKHHLELAPNGTAALLTALQQKVKEMETKLAAVRAQARTKEDGLAQEMSRLQADQRTNSASRAHKDSELQKVSQRMKELEQTKQVQSRQTNASKLEAAEEKMSAAKAQYEAFMRANAVGEADKKVHALEREHNVLKLDLEQESQAIAAASENEEEQRDLSARLRAVAADREQLLQEAMGSRALAELLGAPLADATAHTLETAAAEVRRLKLEAEASLTDARKADMELKRAQAEQQTLLRQAQQRLARVQQEKNQLSAPGGAVSTVTKIIAEVMSYYTNLSVDDSPDIENPIKEPLATDDLTGALQVLAEDAQRTQKYTGSLEGRKEVFGYLLSKARKEVAKGRQPECRCCRRVLSTAEYTVYEKNCEENIGESFEREVAQTKEREKKCADFTSALQAQARPWRRFKELVPEEEGLLVERDAARTQATQIEEKLRASATKLASCSSRVDLVEKALSQAQALVTESNRIESHAKEAKVLQQKLNNWASASMDGRSLDELKASYQKNQDKKEKLERDLSSARAEQHSQMARALSLTNKKNDTAKDFEMEKQKSDSLQRTRQQLAEAQTLVESLTSELVKLDSREAPLRQELATVSHQLESVRAQNRSAEDAAAQQLQMCRGDTSQLAALSRAADAATKSDLPGRKLTTQRDIERAKEMHDHLEAELAEAAEQERMLKAGTEKQTEQRKSVQDNLSLRHLQRQVKDMQARHEALGVRQQQEGVTQNSRNMAEVQNRMGECKESRAELGGRLTALRDQGWDLKQRLKGGSYAGVQEKRRKKLIDVETTAMAVADLEKYWTALDKALMRYHHMKIAEINKIIRELWQITYKGGDIDMIEIVSGEDGASNRAGRSYNYRVAMRKGSTILDMKGRCSAGQRVLASIVIRLALAETFCINCGILALDEPTTNLDFENKDGLAKALARIIAQRSQQSNFQLIVITHDEEFVGTMRTQLGSIAGFNMPEYYWCVSREQTGGPSGQFYSRMTRKPL